MPNPDDPAVVETVVVSATDLVTALEASHRSRGAETVLRMTPPFSGRMRARLHVVRDEAAADPSPVRLRAESLVEDDCPAPPEPDAVEDELRADDAVDYTVERHRDRYRSALREWRRSVPDYAVDEAAIPAVGGTVTVSVLGTVEEA